MFRGRGFAVRLFVCLLAFSPGQAQTGKDGLRYPSGKIPFFENSTQIRVCSSPWTPAVECDVASTDTPACYSPAGERSGFSLTSHWFSVGSVAGNMVGWFWSFAAFIVMSLYNAALTVRQTVCWIACATPCPIHAPTHALTPPSTIVGQANMTIEQLNSLPQRIDDLSALRVGTWEPYAEWLLEYGIVAVPFEWESTEDERIMMDALVGGEIDALVIDEPSLRHLDAYNCSTVIVETIRPVGVQGQHTAFPANVSSDTVGAFNVALRQLLDEDQLTDLRDEFIYVEGLPCKSSAVNENFMRVTWNDVAGLWVMLGISIAFGLLMVTSYRLWNHWLSKTSLFRKPSSLAHGWSRHLESMADRNMSGKDFGGYSIERSMSGTSEHSAEVRDLVMALQKQVASVEALIKEQQRQGL